MADESRKYQAWLRKQRCARCGKWPPSYVHHATHGRGIGQRSHDRDAVPLCFTCHDGFHSARATFAGLSREERNSWQARAAGELRAAFDALRDPEIF